MAEVESSTLRALRTSMMERIAELEDEVARAEMVSKEARVRLQLANSEATAAIDAVAKAKTALNQAIEALKDSFPEAK